MADEDALPGRVPRPLDKAGTSKRLRGYTVTPEEAVYVREMRELLQRVEFGRSLFEALRLPAVASLEESKQILEDEIEHVLTYKPPPRLARNTHKGIVRSVDDALALPHIHNNESYFLNEFVFPSDLVRSVAAILFPNGLCADRRRPISGEEALLIVLAMGRGHSSAGTAALFDVSLSHIATYHPMAMDRLWPRAERLLNVRHLARFAQYGEKWGEALMKKFAERLRQRGVNDISEYWLAAGGPRAVFDGLRIPIARPQNAAEQEVTWSGYKKENDLLTGGIVSPCGLFLALTQVVGGHQNDLATLTEETRVAFLAAELPVLCDGAFHEHPGVVIPLPRIAARAGLDISNAECGAASACRVPVEWSFGRLQSQFPRAFDRFTNRLDCANVNPETLLRVYAMLSNVLSLTNGNQGSEYFNLGSVMSVDAYLNWGV